MFFLDQVCSKATGLHCVASWFPMQCVHFGSMSSWITVPLQRTSHMQVQLAPFTHRKMRSEAHSYFRNLKANESKHHKEDITKSSWMWMTPQGCCARRYPCNPLHACLEQRHGPAHQSLPGKQIKDTILAVTFHWARVSYSQTKSVLLSSFHEEKEEQEDKHRET